MKGNRKIICFNLKGERLNINPSTTMGELNNYKKKGLLIPLLIKQEN